MICDFVYHRIKKEQIPMKQIVFFWLYKKSDGNLSNSLILSIKDITHIVDDAMECRKCNLSTDAMTCKQCVLVNYYREELLTI